MSTETTFQVPNLNCGHCVASVTKALTALHPMVDVQADPSTKRVRVDAPASVDRAQLVAALTEAGYPPA